MKVISFHSYKGGRGRTTAIASIANLYARSGKNVALLDVDVTAPWLHTRYNVREQDLVSRGWLRGLLKELGATPPSMLPPVDLDNYSIRVDSLEQGSVRLLAPGNPETADYWRWMAEEFPRFLGVRADPPILESWRDLRALIANSEPRPDVLLIDAPAGYHQASAYVAMAIADTAVLFAQADHADAMWTTQMVKMMREARPKHASTRYGEMRVIGVRARYPGYVLADLDAESVFDSFKQRYSEAEFDHWVSLESDPRVELREQIEIPIPLETTIHRTRLVEGYAELLATGLGLEPSQGLSLLDELPEGAVEPGERPQFFLLEEQGILTNPADDTRNVSFRVETFCALLDDLHKELLADVGNPQPQGTLPLLPAGREPGRNFGSSLGNQLDRLDPPPDDETRIRRWCEFDSRVGFGNLRLEQFAPSAGGDRIEGTIAVVGNFLAANRNAADNPLDLCPLMTGYIEGVLSMLLRDMPAEIAVNHPSDRCMRFHRDRSSCEFHFTLPVAARPTVSE